MPRKCVGAEVQAPELIQWAEYEVFLRWMQQRAAARVGIVSYSAEKLSNHWSWWVEGQLRKRRGTV